VLIPVVSQALACVPDDDHASGEVQAPGSRDVLFLDWPELGRRPGVADPFFELNGDNDGNPSCAKQEY
jgi:hypothetical protein